HRRPGRERDVGRVPGGGRVAGDRRPPRPPVGACRRHLEPVRSPLGRQRVVAARARLEQRRPQLGWRERHGRVPLAVGVLWGDLMARRYTYLSVNLGAPFLKIADLNLTNVEWQRLRNGAGTFRGTVKLPPPVSPDARI